MYSSEAPTGTFHKSLHVRQSDRFFADLNGDFVVRAHSRAIQNPSLRTVGDQRPKRIVEANNFGP